MEAKPNQSFSDDWNMPRGLVWKTYWQRTKADIKYYTRTFRENNLGLVLIFFAQFFASIVSCNFFAFLRGSHDAGRKCDY